MKKNKKRIAVLFGGNSSEREISLESGRNILYKLSLQKYEAIPLFVNKDFKLFNISNRLLVRNSTQEIEQELTIDMQVKWNDLPQICEFVFIGLHGGKGENGSVQGALEMLGMPYNGSSVLASSLCADKYRCNQFLKTQGFDVSKAVLVSKENWPLDTTPIGSTRDELIKKLTFPFIVKPHDDGCSMGVAKAENEVELKEKIKALFVSGKSHALIEECISGMELTVGVIGNENPKALPPSQAIAVNGLLSIQEKFLPGAGENQTPARLPVDALKFVQNTVEEVYKAIGCKGYARIDCFYQSAQESPTSKQRCIIIEINTLPGMTPATCIFHQAAEIGIAPMEFIDQIIKFGLQEHVKDSSIFESSKSLVGAPLK